MLQKLKLNFVKISSTPWYGAVDQGWRSKLHVQVHASPPEFAQPVWQGCPLTIGIKPL